MAQQTKGSALCGVIDGATYMPVNDLDRGSLEAYTCSIFKGICIGELPLQNAVENRKWTVKSHGLMYMDEVLGNCAEPKGKETNFLHASFLSTFLLL